MKTVAFAALAAAFLAAPLAASASQFETSVQNQLTRNGFDTVEAGDLTTNQLARIHAAFSSPDSSKNDTARNVQRIIDRG
ncbi:hypothetical protein [Amaricoccus macauensis]|uniref:hypothetical protein n=1 Tax=Amaricoccus macauensis TaxID=57001 RepID=UPI003C7D6A0B